ncbi:hypothetical protein NA56DRAFT_648300 [Hyaloscypha hepaticicola]|uniref:Heterokaryon incompatibility domain-containing protein n=1 Tax=Hyaloscypha hepaticicola TaxID=2082293 RepID=A0A2J6PUY5_9HELO|nr:hypothetical protein NA56DRAFT_648300 [Hyaloscypha hepaticicola]
MAKIYQDAKRVLICFGFGDPDALAAFQRLTKEVEYKTRSLQELDTRRSLRITDKIRATRQKDFNEMLEPDSENDDELYAGLPILRKPTLGLTEPTKSETSAIDKIFQHPWWERVCVIQEAIVARELRIICERYELAWNVLCQIYPAAFTTKPGQLALSPHEKNLEPFQRLNNIGVRWKHFQAKLSPLGSEIEYDSYLGDGQVRFNINFLVSTFRSSKATDPCDKISALLGLADDSDGIHAT